MHPDDFMSTLRKSLTSAVEAAVLLGTVQSFVETVAIAWIYAGVVLAPRRFFPLQIYDGFVKIYGYVERGLALPDFLGRFIAQGFLVKLALVGDLIAMNLIIAIPLGVALALLMGILRRGTNALSAPAAVLGLAAIEFFLHVTAWVTTVHLPLEPTWQEIARNFARNFVFDGTVLALTALAVGTMGSWFIATRNRRFRLGVILLCMIVATVARLGLGDSVSPHLPATALAGPTRQAVAPGYNVILVSIDSLRADHLGAYGYPRDTSPTIDRLATDGVLFRHTSSTTAWTLPAHMSILTGRSLLGHGVISDDRSLTDDVPTLAESFRAAGYATGAIVSAPYLEARYGFARGFDDYDDQTIRFENHDDSYASVTAPLLQQTAAKWLGSHTNEKFFLFLHYWDVHYDYDPGPPYESMFDPDYEGDVDGRNFYFNPAVNRNMPQRDLEHILALYDGEIRLVDDHLAKLRRTLSRLGIAGRTVLVITADHGDEFFEHGHKGHHRSLYDEILRVPWVLYVPGVQPTRHVIDTEASIADIMPTLLDVLGLVPITDLDGQSLAGLAFKGQPDRKRRTIAELYRKKSLNIQISLRVGPEKVIQHFNRPTVEAYNTLADPGEQRPLPPHAGFVGPRLADLADWLDHRWSTFDARIQHHGIQRVIMDADTQERLRSLGYIQ